MATIVTRIAREKRSIVLPLGIALVLNLLVYALVVYPLGIKSAGASDRAQAAAAERQAAQREESLARALVTGKSRADEELGAFYQKVLPADQSAARRMTYASLPALARRTNVRYEARHFSLEDTRGPDSTKHLGHLVIRMVLQGEYEDIRNFIYQLESSPEFVIIDDVTLLEGTADESLTLTIDLSTYFRQSGNGA